MSWDVVDVSQVSAALPRLFAPDEAAALRFYKYFSANEGNPNTRRAYARAPVEFAAGVSRTIFANWPISRARNGHAEGATGRYRTTPGPVRLGGR
jgi:hypothetical protein